MLGSGIGDFERNANVLMIFRSLGSNWFINKFMKWVACEVSGVAREGVIVIIKVKKKEIGFSKLI